LGVRGAKWLSACLLLLCPAIWFFYLVQSNLIGGNWEYWSLAALILWAGISALVVSFASPKRHEYYFSFLVDGLLLVLWLFIWLASLLA
ncbi:MAG: hypothetical protein ACRCYO_19310, partial [Bacteroidia bacterium]